MCDLRNAKFALLSGFPIKMGIHLVTVDGSLKSSYLHCADDRSRLNSLNQYDLFALQADPPDAAD